MNGDEDKDVDDVIIAGEINGNRKEYSNKEDILLIDNLFSIFISDIFNYSFYYPTLSVEQKNKEKNKRIFDVVY